MDQQKIELFLASNAKKFKPEQLPEVANILTRLDDDKFPLLLSYDFKDPTTMLIISIFAGGFGIDRFMLNETGLGIAKLITCGGCGIWSIIDWFLIQDKTKDYNYQTIVQSFAQYQTEVKK